MVKPCRGTGDSSLPKPIGKSAVPAVLLGQPVPDAALKLSPPGAAQATPPMVPTTRPEALASRWRRLWAPLGKPVAPVRPDRAAVPGSPRCRLPSDLALSF